MSAMNQVDIARIDPQRVAQVVTNRLVAIPTMPKLLALPIILAAAGGALWRDSVLVDVRRPDRCSTWVAGMGLVARSPWCHERTIRPRSASPAGVGSTLRLQCRPRSPAG